MKKNWYVIYTRSRCEKKVASLLLKYNIENYCPLNRVLRQWSDRKKIIHEPLFTSYVFVRLPSDELHTVKSISADVINYVYWLGKPAIIRDNDIECIQQFLNEHMNIKLEKSNIKPDDCVKVLNGPLMNMEGTVTSVWQNKVRMILPSLGYAMVAETALSNVQLIDRNLSFGQLAS